MYMQITGSCENCSQIQLAFGAGVWASGWGLRVCIFNQFQMKFSPLFSSRKKNTDIYISSVQFSRSVMSDSLRPHVLQHTSPSITNSWSLLKLMSIESVMPSNHLILCRPLLLLPSIFPSIRVFSNESALHIRWPKYWSSSFNIS